MSEKRNYKIEQGSAVKASIISIPLGLALFFLLLSVASVIVSKSNIDFEKLKYFIYICLPITSFVSSCVGALLNKQLKGFIIGLIISFIVTFIIFCVIVVMNSVNVTGSFMICAVLSALVGVPGGIIGANLK